MSVHPFKDYLILGVSGNLNTSLTYRQRVGCYFSGGKNIPGFTL